MMDYEIEKCRKWLILRFDDACESSWGHFLLLCWCGFHHGAPWATPNLVKPSEMSKFCNFRDKSQVFRMFFDF